MQTLVLGCGEAFDTNLFNTSLLLRTGMATLLLDCGYSIPSRVWQAVPDPDEIDLIYISHPHADHYFGLPAVLGRMWEDGRTKRLTVLSQPAVLEQIRAAMDLGYRGLSSRFQYEIEWLAAEPATRVSSCNAVFRFAQTKHSVTNYAVRIETGGAAVCYSGDGMWTPESRNLFEAADLLIHEAYSFESSPVHADIGSLLEMSAGAKVKRLALVHVQRGLRKTPAKITDVLPSSALLPVPGDPI